MRILLHFLSSVPFNKSVLYEYYLLLLCIRCNCTGIYNIIEVFVWIQYDILVHVLRMQPTHDVYHTFKYFDVFSQHTSLLAICLILSTRVHNWTGVILFLRTTCTCILFYSVQILDKYKETRTVNNCSRGGLSKTQLRLAHHRHYACMCFWSCT